MLAKKRLKGRKYCERNIFSLAGKYGIYLYKGKDSESYGWAFASERLMRKLLVNGWNIWYLFFGKKKKTTGLDVSQWQVSELHLFRLIVCFKHVLEYLCED